MKPVDIKSSTYIDFDNKNNNVLKTRLETM